ncbi:MAG: RES family NAD+ phosphorylase [Granulosicoccus sp.]
MIWQTRKGSQHTGFLQGELFRLVESQQQVATMSYVDTLEEQALLEEMLESIKPSFPEDSDTYHYLLKTPFRYPPLKWGSRFGRTHEPGIFYGGCGIEVALAESAYYRMVFWFSMDADSVKDKMRTEHTLFSVNYKTSSGIQLHVAPFDEYLAELAHPSSYQSSQLLGSSMREAAVDVFEYQSVRDPEKGTCVGLFTPNAFVQKKPREMSQWFCETSATDVSFKQVDAREVIRFPIDCFLVNNELPLPA